MSIKDWIPVERPGAEQHFGTERRLLNWQEVRARVRPTRWQSFKRWLGNKLIQLGARLGGDDW